MKRFLFLFLTLSLMLAACSSGASGSLESFDASDLRSDLEEMSFQPQLPTLVPFEVTDTDLRKPPSSENALMVDFLSSDQSSNQLSLMAVNGENVESSEMVFEEVEIDDITGQYAVNDEDVMILKWSENGISYNLTYYGEETDHKVTKEELIQTAASFE
ncbi:hypothetical protein [Bacillus sp. SG-1]|uniref:hypothetical protein n=1 Tax=Bacillus sp. SG-1 TaxID=161544 RepID=UPI00015441D8|nr:hypothetical protein [Bacillus sp. SG-1]EDL66620.1 hypothetical protein BSG1_04670 [Bacillus sp. SG-1]